MMHTGVCCWWRLVACWGCRGFAAGMVCALFLLFVMLLVRAAGMARWNCLAGARLGIAGSSVTEVEEESDGAHVGGVDNPYWNPGQKGKICQ